MPLETATYISQLNAANPAHSDQLNQADAHMRLIKSVLQAQFPNWTAAVLTSTQAQIDGVVSTVNTNGIAILADAGAFFKTNIADGIINPAAGEIDIYVAGLSRLKVKASDATVTVPSGTTLVGAGVIPIGGSMPWFSDTLPSSSYGIYAWLNGQAVSRTTYAAAFALLGTTYGAGNGSTTFNLPNLQEVALYGKSTMGGATSPGHITNYVMTALGTIIGTCLHTLSLGAIPTGLFTLNFSDPGHTHTSDAKTQVGGSIQSGGSAGAFGAATINSATTGITASLTDHAGGGSHDNVSPGFACNWVMRIA